MSQSELAELTGLSRPTIANIEIGRLKRGPKTDYIEKISKATGVPVDWFLDRRSTAVPSFVRDTQMSYGQMVIAGDPSMLPMIQPGDELDFSSQAMDRPGYVYRFQDQNGNERVGELIIKGGRLAYVTFDGQSFERNEAIPLGTLIRLKRFESGEVFTRESSDGIKVRREDRPD